MSTWTPAALSSERRRLSGICWRNVEAQHRVSTLKVVDTLTEQARLEELLDQSKPPVPPECRHLHYLLSTPFRYNAPYPQGSRFRRAGRTPGVFYASRSPETAVIEMAFHRLLFFADSPDMPWPDDAGEYTVFSIRYRTGAGLDLTVEPFERDRSMWMHLTDYSKCQDLANAARAVGVELLRYASARDRRPPGGGINLALFTCRAFASREPLARQTWRLHLGPAGARAICTFPETRIGLDREAFAADPRIAAFRWER